MMRMRLPQKRPAAPVGNSSTALHNAVLSGITTLLMDKEAMCLGWNLPAPLGVLGTKACCPAPADQLLNGLPDYWRLLGGKAQDSNEKALQPFGRTAVSALVLSSMVSVVTVGSLC